MEVLCLYEDIRVEQEGPLDDPESLGQLIESGHLPGTEQLKSTPVKCLTFKRTGDKSSGEVLTLKLRASRSSSAVSSAARRNCRARTTTGTRISAAT